MDKDEGGTKRAKAGEKLSPACQQVWSQKRALSEDAMDDWSTLSCKLRSGRVITGFSTVRSKKYACRVALEVLGTEREAGGDKSAQSVCCL